MRKFMALFLVLASLFCFTGIAQAGEPDMVQTSLMLSGATTSAGIRLPRGITSLSVICPTITSATIGLEVSYDNTTYYTHMAYSNNTNVIAAVTAAGTTPKVVEFPGNFAAWRYVRVVSGGAQGADRTFTIYGTKSPH